MSVNLILTIITIILLALAALVGYIYIGDAIKNAKKLKGGDFDRIK